MRSWKLEMLTHLKSNNKKSKAKQNSVELEASLAPDEAEVGAVAKAD